MAAMDAEQPMLATDAPVTFQEAMSVAAMRQALYENLMIADALSSTTKEKIGVHAVGMLLSVCAGCVNAIAFIKFNAYVSHVSGISTAVGLRYEGEQPGDVMEPIEILAYFIAGATLAGLIIPKATLKMGQARYEVVLFIVGALELLCWWHELRHPQMLAAAMGLQNAMITSWSGAVLRTTHMTGTSTDLGSALGRILSRFMRQGFRCGTYTDQDWDEHTVDRQKLVLMCCLLVAFIAGGFTGAWSWGLLQLHALLLPAGLTILLGTAHMGWCFAQWDALTKEKQATEMFARQLSGADEPGAAGKGSDERMEQFIRQMSGASVRQEKSGASGVPSAARAVGA